MFQERRGLLGKLIRDLDALCAPDSGTRAKIVVLKNVSAELISLLDLFLSKFQVAIVFKFI